MDVAPRSKLTGEADRNRVALASRDLVGRVDDRRQLEGTLPINASLMQLHLARW